MPASSAFATTGPGKWTPYALSLRNFATFRYGQEFYRTARKAGSPIVRAYLLGHALELFLKAYLLKAGVKASVLKSRKFGHNLKILLAEARVKGLDSLIHISPAAEQDLVALSEVYPEALRYFSLLYLFVPPRPPGLARLFRLARTFDEKLASHVRVEA